MTIFLLILAGLLVWYVFGVLNIAIVQAGMGDHEFDVYSRTTTLVTCYVGGPVVFTVLFLVICSHLPIRYGTIVGRTIGRMISNGR